MGNFHSQIDRWQEIRDRIYFRINRTSRYTAAWEILHKRLERANWQIQHWSEAQKTLDYFDSFLGASQ